MTLIQSTVQFKNGSLLVFRLVLHQINAKSIRRSSFRFCERWTVVGTNTWNTYEQSAKDKYDLSDTLYVDRILQKKSFNYNINRRTQCIVHLKLKEQYEMALMCHQTLKIHVHFKYLHHWQQSTSHLSTALWLWSQFQICPKTFILLL